MKCPTCGNEIEDNGICSDCSPPDKEVSQSSFDSEIIASLPPHTPPKREKFQFPWPLITGILLILLILSLVFDFFEPVPVEQTALSFETPEAATEFFIHSITNGDFNTALRASATQYVGEHADFEKLLLLNQNFSIDSQLMPSKYPLYKQTNRVFLESRIQQEVVRFVATLSTGNPVDTDEMVTVSPEDVADFRHSLKPARFSTLTVERITLLQPKDETQSASIAEALHVDQYQETLALCSYKGQHYVQGVSLVQQNGMWKVIQFSTSLFPLENAPQLIDLEDYDSFVAQIQQ